MLAVPGNPGRFYEVFLRERNDMESTLKKQRGFWQVRFGPCRFGKYAIEQVRILRELGFDFPIRTTVSKQWLPRLEFGSGF
jgi:predicted nucleotide-binding protein (sugar kinase/HSP70/actin superfamily)